MDPLLPLLGLLRSHAAHGYELKRRAEHDFSPYWRIDFAQLYRTLGRAERNGLVAARRCAGRAGPARKVYALTPRGHEMLATWLDAPFVDRDELVVKARLAADHGRPTMAWWRAQHARANTEVDRCRQRYTTALAHGEEGQVLVAATALHDAETALDALQILLPECRKDKRAGVLTIVGSDDPLLSMLARTNVLSQHTTGSYGGLWSLARDEADVAALHLRDPETGEYNMPFLRRLLPEDDLVVVNLAWRETGLMVAAGNPCAIRAATDLTRPDVRLINRQAAAGTRLLLYMTLRQAGVDAATISGWRWTVATHDQVARAIASGEADVGPGLRASAVRWGLDFVPLAKERYDLAMRRSTYESPGAIALMDVLRGPALSRLAQCLAGYDVASCGDAVQVCH